MHGMSYVREYEIFPSMAYGRTIVCIAHYYRDGYRSIMIEMNANVTLWSGW